MATKKKVYWVDPKKLSVKSCDIAMLEHVIRNQGSSVISDEQRDSYLMIDDLPKEIKGIFCFGSEEEAHSFIKTQIGM